MRRRQHEAQPPAELTVFDGMADGHVTPAAWREAYARWRAARCAWARTHGVDEADLPFDIGDEPWDPDAI